MKSKSKLNKKMFKYKKLIRTGYLTYRIPRAPKGYRYAGLMDTSKGSFAVYVDKKKKYIK